MSAWSKRWFSIEGDKLLWYSKKGSPEPSNYISLISIANIKEFETGHDGIFSFQVKSAERNFFLRTKSQGDLDRWMRALKMHRDLWVKKSKEKKSKLKKKLSQADYRSLEVEKLSAECDALALKVMQDKEKKKKNDSLQMSTTSSQSSSRRNSFTSTSSSSSSLEEHKPTNTNRQETKIPSNRDRESPRELLRESPRELLGQSPQRRDSFRDCRNSPRDHRDSPRDYNDTRRDSFRESTRSTNYRSPRTWNHDSYRETCEYEHSQSPLRHSRESNTSYNQNHSGRSQSPLDDDVLYENVGSRYNSRHSGYNRHTNSPSKSKMGLTVVDTRDEDHFHSPGTPVSKCWGETTVIESKPMVRRSSAKFSNPEVDDHFEDCRDPTFERPTYKRPGSTSVTNTNWVDEMWDSDE
jgi:hypothetical protein